MPNGVGSLCKEFNMVDTKPKTKILDAVFKNSTETEQLVISLNDWQGQKYIDFRWYWKPDDKKDHIPTKKGVSISVDHLSRLAKAIKEAAKLVEGG